MTVPATTALAPARRPLARMSERTGPAAVLLIASQAAELRRRWRHATRGQFATREVSEWSALARSLASRGPAALLLDLRLPELGGIGGVATIQRLRPTTKTIVLTGRPTEAEGVAVLKAGARGYCSRDIDPRLVGKAVDVVQKGEIWVGRKLVPHLIEELAALTEQKERSARPDPDPRLDRLTPGEREIARLVSAGASNKEIARKLDVTERAVGTRLTAILRKLGISSRLDLAGLARPHSRPPSPSRHSTKAS